MFFLILVFVVLTQGSFSSFVLGYEEHCTYTREDAIKCFSKYIDTNNDQKIDLKELEVAKTKYLGWALKMLQWVASWAIDTSTPKIMHDCGAGTKGYFTADDFRRTAKSCMPSQEALCMVKMVCSTADKDMHEVKDPRVKTWWNKWL
jgi:hypothetical protein